MKAGNQIWGTSKIQKGNFFQARVRGKYLGSYRTREEAHLKAVTYAREQGIKPKKGELHGN